jgi:hypothetical protein
MKPQVLYACMKLGDTPLMIGLTNPTKSDKEIFIQTVMKSLAKAKSGTGNCSNPKIKIAGTLSATLETEKKNRKVK